MQETSHPFVLKFIEEFVFKEKSHCIITEFAPGGDLESQIRKKSFTEDETMIYLTMLLLGLHYLHCKGIIHNEFKPGNILIDQLLDGFQVLKITGFNCSKMKGFQTYNSDSDSDDEPDYKCTPLYKSPEVINMQTSTPKSDMWALGIIIYRLVFQGRHPF